MRVFPRNMYFFYRIFSSANAHKEPRSVSYSVWVVCALVREKIPRREREKPEYIDLVTDYYY